ncbi:hypothetical protein MUK42_33180 [Musa troglodytarum]|uniref:Uncharacterized protein n=1 Tax=Musa troglodytarum TaxID=320322 RepID=A0A9E7GM05_9LILI|nr:hypothetical protein MUK42_33180 [Musa troglodytarum]
MGRAVEQAGGVVWCGVVGRRKGQKDVVQTVTSPWGGGEKDERPLQGGITTSVLPSRTCHARDNKGRTVHFDRYGYIWLDRVGLERDARRTRETDGGGAEREGGGAMIGAFCRYGFKGFKATSAGITMDPCKKKEAKRSLSTLVLVAVPIGSSLSCTVKELMGCVNCSGTVVL